MPQLASIGLNLQEYNVHLYIFHYRISAENIRQLKDYAKTFNNLTLHEVIMEDVSLFDELAKFGGNFPPEAYVYLHCHNQLDVDRIMYIDAGDIIINGDISGYYFDDFEGRSFIVTSESLPDLNELVTKEHLSNPKYFDLVRRSYINSGCIVINLKKFRESGRDFFEDYKLIAESLKDKPEIAKNALYLGDQGLLGLAFYDDVKFFGFDDVISKTKHSYPCVGKYHPNLYAPYNFFQATYSFEETWWYIPIILHFSAPLPKPWKRRLTTQDIGKNKGTWDNINHKQLEMHNIWWYYWDKTPLGEAVKNSDELIAHSKPLAQLNPSRYMIEHYLAYRNFEKAKEYIDSGLSLANCETSYFVMHHLLTRYHLETGDYNRALEVIKQNDYAESFSFNHYKAHCYFQAGEYEKALIAYKISYAQLENNKDNAKENMIYLINPVLNENIKWLDVIGKVTGYYNHFKDNPEANIRLIRLLLSNVDNVRGIIECTKYLKNYNDIFKWLDDLPLGDNVWAYLQLISDSGQIERVKLLFERIADMQYKIEPAHEMDKCLISFDAIILPNEHAVALLAPFFEQYIDVVCDYLERTKPKTMNSVHKLAYHLKQSDMFIKSNNHALALEQLNMALIADKRFAPLMMARINKLRG